jgi:hypothetical protein
LSILKIDFSINLNQDINGSVHYSPIFYNWLPTEKDYLVLKTAEPYTILKVWFQPSSQVDLSILQDKRVSVSKLKGNLQFNNVPTDLISIFKKNKTQYVPYEEFGKKIIKKMLYPPLSRLLNILRINYGQYWIRQLPPWNSLEMGLGQYCQMLEMKWSMDNENTCYPFIPSRGTRASRRFRVSGEEFFEQFILKNDWQALSEFINSHYEPPVAAILLSRAHQFGDLGDLRSGFIEGISALELAIKKYIQSKISNSDTILQSIYQFWDMPIKSKVIAITSGIGTIRISDIESTIKATDIRNKIAHVKMGFSHRRFCIKM